MVLVKDYEDKHIHLPEINTIAAIKLKMEELVITPKDLEPIIGTKRHVSSILSGRREITLKMAQKLKDYLQLSAEVFYSGPLKNGIFYQHLIMPDENKMMVINSL